MANPSKKLLDRKRTHFVLWLPTTKEDRPGLKQAPPELVISNKIEKKKANELKIAEADLKKVELTQSSLSEDLWEIAATDPRLGLISDQIYYYWFEITDTQPYKIYRPYPRLRCTDPTAYTVEWSLLAEPLWKEPYGRNRELPLLDNCLRQRKYRLPPTWRYYMKDDCKPAGVVLFQNGELVEPNLRTHRPVNWTQAATNLSKLPVNQALVIYEVPTRWTKIKRVPGRTVSKSADEEVELAVGTFQDVTALIDPKAQPGNFKGVPVLESANAYLKELGINALELLPPADSFQDREWGYGTSNYFAPDYSLCKPETASIASSEDLAILVKTCHDHGIRFFADMVLGYATRYSYQNLNFLAFHVQYCGEGDKYNGRDGWGGDLFNFEKKLNTYNPGTGNVEDLNPAGALLLTYLERWMKDIRIDGIRLDGIPTIDNWDFIKEFKDSAHTLWQDQAQSGGLNLAQAEDRFMVIGENLQEDYPGLLQQKCLDSVWNFKFRVLLRENALLGDFGANFEDTIQQMLDCRKVGFQNGLQAINYFTSHDDQRLYNYFLEKGIVEIQPRVELAFACLLTAVGIPMFLAGEEFADKQDRPLYSYDKQVDPVNYDRVNDNEAKLSRTQIFKFVSALVKLRTTTLALQGEEINFLHFDPQNKIAVWQRGLNSEPELIVVAANFSENPMTGPFSVANWPTKSRRWEVLTCSDSDSDWKWKAINSSELGLIKLDKWEAKIYRGTVAIRTQLSEITRRPGRKPNS